MQQIEDLLNHISRRDASIVVSIQETFQCEENEIEELLLRLRKMLEQFRIQFPDHPKVSIVRAPGRVNLIGEHTDYNGYPVLPIAIDRDILIALTPLSEPKICISNTNPKFEAREFSLSDEIRPGPTGDWENYVKAGAVGVINEYDGFPSQPKGMAAIFCGNIPPAAGLSSSSAMVVISAFALLVSNGIKVDRLDLAEILARAERFVGTEGGGMDQAASLLGQAGAALKIDFFPLRVKPLPLPQGHTFVVAHSLVHAPKTESARLQYNRRPIECRLATALLAREIQSRTDKNFSVQRLADLSSEKTGINQKDLDDWARVSMSTEAMSLNEIAAKLEQSAEEVMNENCKLRDGSIFSEPHDGFKVWQRYRHIVTEAQRINDAVAALEATDMPRFGELMNASHESCRDDYEISCPELDVLVKIARKNGALGARLTGAGFGGCAVCLVKEEATDSFIERIRKEYYENYLGKHQPELLLYQTDLKEAIFACRAAQGAGMLFD